MMDGETEKVYSSSYVFGNAAAGGTGQPGYGNRTGEGGHSGRAHGGAFMIQCPSFTLEGVLAKENTAAGGSGADAKVFVEKKVISDVGGIIISEDIFDHFGRGGDCGDGYGGAVYMTSEETVIVNSVFVTNQATGYGLPPITLLVGSENNGVWKLDVSKDPVYPYGGRATGRVPGTEDNAQGGHGGSAYGGALYGAGGQLWVESSVFAANHAIGGNGGAGAHASREVEKTEDRYVGKGGNGGDAYGGALYLGEDQMYQLRRTVIWANMTLGGRGGNGGGGAAAPIDYPNLGGDGGPGGRGGNALGAGIYSRAWSSAPQTQCLVESSVLKENQAVGGDGGIGGTGGRAKEFTIEDDLEDQAGGNGGRGGAGGSAEGGAIYANQLYLRKSTLDRNLVVGGWGGQGGHGYFGPMFGGKGGVGGNGGTATGGGFTWWAPYRSSARWSFRL